MRNCLLQLVTNITGKSRIDPRVKWDKRIWIANIFRAWEYIAGRKFGIRAESSSSVAVVNGKLIIRYELYSFEAHIVHIEVITRLWLKAIYNLLKFNPQPNFSYRPAYVTLGFLGLSFFFKTPELFLPLFGLAIALDTTSQGTATTTSPLTWSHTCTGSNLILIGSFLMGASAPVLSVPTYSAAAMTLAGSQRDNGNNQILGLYYKLTPATGSNTVSSGFSGTLPSAHAGVVSWSGVKQTAQPDAVNGGTGAVTDPSMDVTTVADNSWAVGGIVANSAPTGNNQTLRQTLSAGGSFNAYGRLLDSNSAKTPAGAVTFTWNGGSLLYGIQLASFSPDTGGGGGGSTRVPLRSLLGVGT